MRLQQPVRCFAQRLPRIFSWLFNLFFPSLAASKSAEVGITDQHVRRYIRDLTDLLDGDASNALVVRDTAATRSSSNADRPGGDWLVLG